MEEDYDHFNNVDEDFDEDEDYDDLENVDEDFDEDEYEDEREERRHEELMEIAASCTCGAWVYSKGEVIHVADCCCGAQ